MSDRNNIQLAIGYGLGVGMLLAGIAFISVQFISSFFNFGVSVYIMGAVAAIGGVAIAVYNALKLDRKALSALEDASERD